MGTTTGDNGNPSPPPLRVLLLEDNPRDAELAAAVLRRSGFAPQLETAATPESFQEQWGKSDFDVVVADYNLASWTAMDALAVIRESGKDVPLIVLTGALGDESAVECIKQGAEDFVLKDRPARLPMAIQRALENKRLREERKRAEAELEHSRQEQLRLRDEFLSHVSHELRSPLASIHQFTTILLDGLAGEIKPEQRDCLEIVLRNSRQLSAMVEDLLTITRVGAGKLTIEPQYTVASNPSGNIVETLRVLKSRAASKNLDLRSDLPSDLPPIWVDPQRTCQILTNLVENAIKFTPEGGSITVRFRRFDEDPNFVLASVADTGCGISRENRQAIFERLFQVASGDESRKGLGLGLYLARSLAICQGGRIWVESELGQGSTFFFTLPVFQLAPLLTPVVTESNLEKRSLWLLTVTFPGVRGSPLDPTEQQALRRLHEVLKHLVRPETDVVLPAMGGSDKGLSIYVLACVDPDGVQPLVNRLRERLSSPEILGQIGGSQPTISFAALDIAPERGAVPWTERVEEVAAHVERLAGNPPTTGG
jgi:signal transduction histidine kinase